MIQMALPIAPIQLMPFIVLFFILVFPLWVVGIAVLGLLLVLSRAFEWFLRLIRLHVERPLSGPIGNAFHWTLSWGGLAQRRDRPPPGDSPPPV
jgi:hypothetical protein